MTMEADWRDVAASQGKPGMDGHSQKLGRKDSTAC